MAEKHPIELETQLDNLKVISMGNGKYSKWQKGDAVDLVLLFTALCTMVRRVIPVEVSSIRSRQAVVSSKVSISKRLEVSISRCRGAW
mgnify:CR=1 FL=1